MSNFEPGGLDEEELALGSRRPPRNLLGRLSWRWRALVLALLVAALLVPVLATSSHTGKPSAEHPPRTPTTRSPTPSTSYAVPPPAAPKPFVTPIHRDFLGVHARWELFGWAGPEMIRIQFARGRVTTTQVPPVGSSGPLYFVAGTHQVLVHPLDFVAGYVVPDGQLPKPEPAHLACGGPALPGPVADTVWVPPCSGRTNKFLLTRLDGTRVGETLRLPSGSAAEAVPDGQGYALLPGFHRLPTLDVRPSGVTRVARGPVLAVGPTRWLLRRCHDHVCRGVVVNRRTGVRRVLRKPLPPVAGTGEIAPDGSSAALWTPKTKLLVIVDLRTGICRVVPVGVYDYALQTMVWSPDSRWLFGIDFGAYLWAVNARTGRVFHLTVPLHIPLLAELAIRPAPAS
jgi:hypothetical protein